MFNATNKKIMFYILQEKADNICLNCLAQTGFAAFGKGMQFISGSPYAENEQLSTLMALKTIDDVISLFRFFTIKIRIMSNVWLFQLTHILMFILPLS